MSVLGLAPDFEEDDSFLHAMLGLLVAGGEIRALVDSTQTEVPVEAPAPDDAMVYALLGLIRLQNKLTGVVESWATEEPRSTPRVQSEVATPPLENILR
ncbi:MAG: hypothetical protein ABJE95_23535 [Byssovorax sp.]